MEAEEKFVVIAGLLCEPVRARMLWNLLDGRAYTAGELALTADVSATSASNHLAKLLEADLVKVEMQGRHRYYSFSNTDVAYAVEALANLADHRAPSRQKTQAVASGLKYCRTCYDHLAGFVAVKIVEAIERKGYLKKQDKVYTVTGKGWQWFSQFGISQNDFTRGRRPLARQCLDWSERRPHLAGQLGAVFLDRMVQKRWFKKVAFSRELVITSKGNQELYELLGVALS